MHKNKALIKALKFLNVAKAMAESWQKQGIVVGSELSNKLDEIEFSDHYCDGWTVDEGGIIAIGNWNDPDSVKSLDSRYHLLSRLVTIFERLHITVEWCDMGCICQEDGCGGFIRTEPGHYFDKLEMPIFIDDIGYVCGNCIRNDPNNYIEQLTDSDTLYDELGIDFSKHGYERLLNGDKRTQTIDITSRLQSQKAFADRIRDTGICDIIFQRTNDENGYPTRLCAWVPKGAQRKAVHWRVVGNTPACKNAQIANGYTNDYRLARSITNVTCKSCLRAALKSKELDTCERDLVLKQLKSA